MQSSLDFLLYGNVWIAACSAAQVAFTFRALGPGHVLFWEYTALVFSGTLLVYSAHSAIGAREISLGDRAQQRRFGVMHRYWSVILGHGALGALGVLYFSSMLPLEVLSLLFIPLGLSASYVLPHSTGLSIRSLPFLKNVVVALSWSVATAWIPASGLSAESDWAWIVLVERFFFLFALTIPFEIRDARHDRSSAIRTLPHQFGIRGSKRLAFVSVSVGLACAAVLTIMDVYRPEALIAYAVAWTAAVLLIHGSCEQRDDYYFTGLVDGVMVLMALTTIALTA